MSNTNYSRCDTECSATVCQLEQWWTEFDSDAQPQPLDSELDSQRLTLEGLVDTCRRGEQAAFALAALRGELQKTPATE